MADLTTTPAGIWVLQALLGIESMPTALGLRPFIPSVDAGPTVATLAGERPLTHTAEYAALGAAGAIGADGGVDEDIRDWMTVVGRPEREVVVAIRRPAPAADGVGLVRERTLAICQRGRWLAMIARHDDEVVLAPIGETGDPHRQVELTCDVVLHAFGAAEPAAVAGVNLPTERLQAALTGTNGGRWATAAALERLGLAPDQVEVLVAATRLDESAMAVVAVVDNGPVRNIHPTVFTLADTAHGRISITHTTGPDKSAWTSIWPTTPSALRQDLVRLLGVPDPAASH